MWIKLVDTNLYFSFIVTEAILFIKSSLQSVPQTMQYSAKSVNNFDPDGIRTGTLLRQTTTLERVDAQLLEFSHFKGDNTFFLPIYINTVVSLQ